MTGRYFSAKQYREMDGEDFIVSLEVHLNGVNPVKNV